MKGERILFTPAQTSHENPAGTDVLKKKKSRLLKWGSRNEEKGLSILLYMQILDELRVYRRAGELINLERKKKKETFPLTPDCRSLLFIPFSPGRRSFRKTTKMYFSLSLSFLEVRRFQL